MKILVSGGKGLIGSKLVPALKTKGHEVYCLTRSPRSSTDIAWNYETSEIDLERLEGIQGVFHLAGENIAEGRWTIEKKKRIYESRVLGTSFLISSLLNNRELPQFYISTSAVGFYGNRDEEELSEESSPGNGFVAEVCKDWEKACNTITERGVRTCIARIGIVLDRDGGALKKMLLPFKLGLGGKIGTGNQWVSWIDIDDLIKAFIFLAETSSAKGIYNLTATNPVRQKDFARCLAIKLHRPSFVQIPKTLIQIAAGEMANELLLTSVKVYPKRILSEGFRFEYSRLQDSLDHLL